jgi:hypothetical protein
MTDLAVACWIDFKDGRRLWIPPEGRPFWCHCQPVRDATDEELEALGITL